MTAPLCLHVYDLADRHQMNIWEAIILAAALEAGTEEIYTEDIPGATFTTSGILEGIKYINPFRT